MGIAAINGTFNCAHRDAAVRAQGVRRFDWLMDAADALGCDLISICTGTRSARTLWTYDAENENPDAWDDMTGAVRAIVRIAEARGKVLLVETEASSIVNTAEKAAGLLHEIDSPALKMIIDCANLFRPGEARRANVRPAIRRAFELFGDDIRLAHGKDIYESEGIAFAPTGRGIVDFPFFFEQLRAAKYDGDMILHGIGDEKAMAQAVALVAPMVLEYDS